MRVSIVNCQWLTANYQWIMSRCIRDSCHCEGFARSNPGVTTGENRVYEQVVPNFSLIRPLSLSKGTFSFSLNFEGFARSNPDIATGENIVYEEVDPN